MSETKLPAIIVTPPDEPMDVVQADIVQRFAHLRLVEEEKAHWPQSAEKNGRRRWILLAMRKEHYVHQVLVRESSYERV